MKPIKEKVSITLDVDLVEILRAMSAGEDKPFSRYINDILRHYMGSEDVTPVGKQFIKNG